MSTSPDPIRERPDDLLVNQLSQWLARHIGDEDLRRIVDEVGTDELAPDQAEAVEELRSALDRSTRGELEVAVRETMEALALGG
jgi:hypothetical protein